MVAIGIGLLLGGLMMSLPVREALASSASGLAYQDVLNDPGDLGKTFAYAEKLVEERNFESAAAVLERLAIRYPQQAEIRLELGVMYYRLNSPQMAKDQFERVLAMAGASDDVKRKAAEFLLHDAPLTERSRFSGNVTFGMQYQSNATSGANKDEFNFNGNNVKTIKKDNDADGVVGFNVNHVYDFDSQWGTALESSLGGRGTFYVDNDHLNEIDLRGRTGVGFTIPGFATGQVRIQPHVSIDTAIRDEELLELGGGPGIEASYKPVDQWKLTIGYDAMFRDYNHVGSIGDTQDLSGTDQTIGLNSTWEIIPRTYLIGDVGGHFFNARKDYLDYNSVSTGIALLQGYNSPISFLPYDWWIRIGGSYEHRWFQGADPDTTAGQSRLDKVWHAEIANVIPITDSWRLTQQFDYDQVNSNERTSDYHNYAASLLATWQF
jgi:hypothetical protein